MLFFYITPLRLRLAPCVNRFLRCGSLALFFFLVVHFYNRDGTPAPVFIPLDFQPSSYDWSVFRPFFPVNSLQPLPSAKPQKRPKIQCSEGWLPKFDRSLQEQRRQEVKKVMKKAWNSYKNLAWMRDELAPLTGKAVDPYGGWAATLIDALDTLWIMDMKDEFYEAVQAAVTIDWGEHQGVSCNMFETTIRHLGGLLSAYDLSKESVLLEKAIELGDMLHAAFDTPTHMPPFWFNFEAAKIGMQIPDANQPAASATTLTMEFTRLAQLTGNHKYYDAVARVTDALYHSQNQTQIPGMWPTYFNLRTANFTQDTTFTLGALSDSMYEYLLKMVLLLGGTEPKYEQMYRTTSDVIKNRLLYRPMTPENSDILFSGTYHVGHTEPFNPHTQHLACFAGGMFAVGGKTFGIPEHVDIGARLTRGCIWAYTAFPTGLGPESFTAIPCATMQGCEWDEQQWNKSISTIIKPNTTMPRGVKSVQDSRYQLRPEAIESVFIMHRITGQKEYREAAWTMFKAIESATDCENGNAVVVDVATTGKPEHDDRMESFWFAETLKYFYLIFSPNNVINLDDYVLNTEAHPFRRPSR